MGQQYPRHRGRRGSHFYTMALYWMWEGSATPPRNAYANCNCNKTQKVTKLLGNRRDTIRLIDNVGDPGGRPARIDYSAEFCVMIPMQHEMTAYIKRDTDILQTRRN